jgi:hypothetical protein
MTKIIRQTMFKTGEVDQTTWKRTDVEEYITAAQSLLNCEVGTTGLVKKRKGTKKELNATGYAQAGSRMYEFVDKNQNYFLLISANGAFHVFDAPTNRSQVITGRGTNVVTGRGKNVVVRANEFTFIQTITTPYMTSDLDEIDYTEDSDSLVISHPRFAPARIYISSYAPLTFTFQYLDIYPLPSYDFQTINYNAFTVSLSVAGSVLTYAITNPAGATGFTTAWIGGSIIGGGATDVDPIGYAIITNVVNVGNTTTFTATVQIPFKTVGFATQGSQYSIRQPSWSTALGWPAKVLFYQNRLWFARTSTLPETVFGSKVNAPINFDVGTGKDTDAIVYTLGVTNSGAINWLNGGKQLEILCQNIEFACPQDQNSALTPGTFTVKQQSSYGSSGRLKPISYINDSYFSAKTGKAFINYHFNGVGLTYSSTNISAASAHLVKNPSNRALLRGSDNSQDNFVYFLNPDDDTITAFQFASEYKLAALTPIVFEDDIDLIDITTVDNTVYILKYYDLTDQFIVESFTEAFPSTFVKIDSAEEADMQTSGLITGLDRFNGYVVQVIYQNQDFGEYTVSSGQIIVNNPDEIADTVIVGQLFDVDIETMYVFAGQAASPLMKNISRIYVDYYQSLDFEINGNLVPYQNFADIQAGLPLQPQTDTAIISPVNGWSRFETISITQSSPFDLQILAIAYQIDYAVI